MRLPGWAVLLAVLGCGGEGADLQEECVVLEAGLRAAHPTEVQVSGVDLGLSDEVVLDIEHLHGWLESRVAGAVVALDEPQSFVLRVQEARMALDLSSLEHLVRARLEERAEPPVAVLELRAVEGRLEMIGELPRLGHLPFDMEGEVWADERGRLILSVVDSKVAGLGTRGLLDVLGLGFGDAIDIVSSEGIRLRSDHVLLEPGHDLPGPGLEGHLTAAWLEDDGVRLVFGEPSEATPDSQVVLRGGHLRMGALTMEETELWIHPRPPDGRLSLRLDRLQQQVGAGYMEGRPDGGLDVHLGGLE